jgi:hypothetical protein
MDSSDDIYEEVLDNKSYAKLAGMKSTKGAKNSSTAHANPSYSDGRKHVTSMLPPPDRDASGQGQSVAYKHQRVASTRCLLIGGVVIGVVLVIHTALICFVTFKIIQNYEYLGMSILTVCLWNWIYDLYNGDGNIIWLVKLFSWAKACNNFEILKWYNLKIQVLCNCHIWYKSSRYVLYAHLRRESKNFRNGLIIGYCAKYCQFNIFLSLQDIMLSILICTNNVELIFIKKIIF